MIRACGDGKDEHRQAGDGLVANRDGTLLHGVAMALYFALPVVAYMSYSSLIMDHGFQLSNMGNAYADLYEFSWRYQLPALVTLLVAGAFGVIALVRFCRARRQERRAAREDRTGTVELAESADAADAVGSADDLAAAGSEQAAP